MRIRPEQLRSHVQKQLLPLYLVTGDEVLLVQEACDTIRARCREEGINERQVLQVEGKYDWNNLHAVSAEMSLFAERKLIELRIPSGKPGTEGSKALQHYLQNPSPDNVLLVVAGKIDKQSTNSKWFKALDQAGAVIQLWPIEARDLPRWLHERLRQAGLQIDEDALPLLCDRVEGNLLAAAQEIEKLRLVSTDQRVSCETIASTVANNARYDLFSMVDHALTGDASGAMKMLQGLRAEGTESAVVLWALAREIRLLYQCQGDISRGRPQNQVLQAQRVWDKRKPIVGSALARHSLEDLASLMQQATLADRCIKGLAAGQPWDLLGQLLLELATRVSAAFSNSARTIQQTAG